MMSDFWGSIENRDAKEDLAQKVAQQLRPGQTVGVGSGSTSFLALRALAERIETERISGVSFVPTSLEIKWTIKLLGLRLGHRHHLDWLFDGADAVDPQKQIIKGRGGALLREKELFRLCPKRIILADSSKHVSSLQGIPIPIELDPRAFPMSSGRLEGIGAQTISLRTGSGKDGPVITESGNIILDAAFAEIYPGLEQEINRVSGVVENGLFQDFAVEIL